MYKSKVEPGSRSQMLQWINRNLNINETRIQNLGTGVVYCMLVNHYHPNTIHPSKIINNPRSQNDYRLNLRRLQQALASLQVKCISLDVFKLAEMNYTDNWNLICKIYKLLTEREKNSTSDAQRWQAKNIQNKMDNSFNKNSVVVNPLTTPMKGQKVNDQGGKMRWHTMNMIEQIKKIVSSDAATDRNKVGQLRRLLGLQEEEGHQSETDLKDLLSDYKKNQQVIQID